jgi:hypothetical protein
VFGLSRPVYTPIAGENPTTVATTWPASYRQVSTYLRRVLGTLGMMGALDAQAKGVGIMNYVMWAMMLFIAVYAGALSGYPIGNRLFSRVWNFVFSVISAAFGLTLGVFITLNFMGQMPDNIPLILILVLTVAPGLIGAMLAEWIRRCGKKS